MSPDAIASPRSPDRFLVCGLGSLGQHCVLMLTAFGGEVSAIDIAPKSYWENPEVPSLLRQLALGDCRRPDLLKQCGIESCRAILIVTEDERANIETAFAARLLNPHIRLVVRSDKEQFNQLLAEQLGNFVAFEPTQLSAPAFALAALRQDLLGIFQIDHQRFQVVQHRMQPGDRWCNGRPIYELNTRHRRVLEHDTHLDSDLPQSTSAFYRWHPQHPIQAGDVVITVEHASPSSTTAIAPDGYSPKATHHPTLQQRLQRSLQQFWQTRQTHQLRLVTIVCGLLVLALLLLGTVLYALSYPGLPWLDALYATAILLLGGYGDLYSDIQLSQPVPAWLRAFSLGLTLAGTAFVGVLYALLTQRLLTLRFEFLNRRPPLPLQDHVVVIGLGRVGKQILQVLQQLHCPVVGVTPEAIAPDELPNVPVVVGQVTPTLSKANLPTASSVIAVTEDEMQNLEVGILTHRLNPKGSLVIRTYNRQLSDNIAQLFPYAQVLCVSDLAAEAFAAAAFGERILSLFRLHHQTILVTEYTIEAQDTLMGRLLAEVAYGYGVVPIYHYRPQSGTASTMPSDDLRLQEGDRLVVLARSAQLKQIEWGTPRPKRWGVRVLRARTAAALFEGANEIARISGCDLAVARSLMEQLPSQLSVPLYHHQALRLVRNLERQQVTAEVTDYLIPSSLG